MCVRYSSKPAPQPAARYRTGLSPVAAASLLLHVTLRRTILWVIRPLRWLWLLLVVLGSTAAAESEDGSVTVVEVPSGNLLELDDGRLVRLAGIRLPADVERDSQGLTGQGLAAQARAALAGMVEGRAVRLEPASPAGDRHGRLVAQLWRHDGLWLQGALLEQGLVQVQTRPGEVALAAEMAAREQAARRAAIGVWAHGLFGPRSVHQVAPLVGSFQIVQGRVVRVAPTERYVYLNFGADWQRDFTLRVARSGERSFREAGIELEQLAGRDVEVRGYVLEAGGPLIELSHPEQIRIRPASAGGKPASSGRRAHPNWPRPPGRREGRAVRRAPVAAPRPSPQRISLASKPCSPNESRVFLPFIRVSSSTR